MGPNCNSFQRKMSVIILFYLPLLVDGHAVEGKPPKDSRKPIIKRRNTVHKVLNALNDIHGMTKQFIKNYQISIILLT